MNEIAFRGNIFAAIVSGLVQSLTSLFQCNSLGVRGPIGLSVCGHL